MLGDQKRILYLQPRIHMNNTSMEYNHVLLEKVHKKEANRLCCWKTLLVVVSGKGGGGARELGKQGVSKLLSFLQNLHMWSHKDILHKDELTILTLSSEPW